MPSPSSSRSPDDFSDATWPNPDNGQSTELTFTMTPEQARDAYPVIQPSSVPASLYVYAAGDNTPYTFQTLTDVISAQLRVAPRIHRGMWQAMDVSDSDLHITRELMNYTILYDVPEYSTGLIADVKPDMPWAERHFQERVCGEPLNPPPSHEIWPYHGSDKERHIDRNKHFSHTYPERFWPKFANEGETRPNGRQVFVPHNGVRFAYGDLDDMVGQLVHNPYTRQAVLPVWFPEDTGAQDRRVPCSLAYHFMCDADLRLHVWYYLRACDFVRHFKNDVFLASRLLQWVCHEVLARSENSTIFKPGRLNMTISSLHVFEGDMDKLS